jgi:hypothetical protein
LRRTSICARCLRILLAALGGRSGKTARDRSQAVQARNPVDQLRDADPEILLNVGQTVFLQRRHGKKQRRQPRIDIELEPGNDQRHSQRMTPDVLAAAELAIAIDRAGKIDGQRNPRGLGSHEPLSQHVLVLFEVALRGDRVNDRDHGRIIRARQSIRHNARLLATCRRCSPACATPTCCSC